MGHQVIRDARVWVAQYDFSGHASESVLDYSADAPDDTPLNATTRSRLAGGLQDIGLSMAGLWEAAASGAGRPDNALEANLGLADIPVSLCYVPGAAEGSRAFTFRALEAQYSQGGQIGAAHKFNARAMASQGPLVRGLLLSNRTISINVTSPDQYTLAAVGANERAYAALHVLAVSGSATPTLNFDLQSLDAPAGVATARVSFVSTAVGAQWGSAIGPISDQYWRFVATVSGTAPSFTVVAVFGVAPLS